MASLFSFTLISALLVCFATGLTPDEILDSCEASGADIGKRNAAAGCAAVNKKCITPITQRIALPEAKAAQVDDLQEEVLNRTCDLLFKNKCYQEAQRAVPDLGDVNCSLILSNGPFPQAGCETRADAVKIFQNGLDECNNPCACSVDGVANGIETFRGGCKQHLLHYGDEDFFCYVIESKHCTKETITESKMYPGTYWKICG